MIKLQRAVILGRELDLFKEVSDPGALRTLKVQIDRDEATDIALPAFISAVSRYMGPIFDSIDHSKIENLRQRAVDEEEVNVLIASMIAIAMANHGICNIRATEK